MQHCINFYFKEENCKSDENCGVKIHVFTGTFFAPLWDSLTSPRLWLILSHSAKTAYFTHLSHNIGERCPQVVSKL